MADNESKRVERRAPDYVSTDMNDHQVPVAVEEGAKTSVQLATLPTDAPTRRFIHLGEELS